LAGAVAYKHVLGQDKEVVATLIQQDSSLRYVLQGCPAVLNWNRQISARSEAPARKEWLTDHNCHCKLRSYWSIQAAVCSARLTLTRLCCLRYTTWL